MRDHVNKKFLGLLIIPVLLSSCSFAPDYASPQIDLPSQWPVEYTEEQKPAVKPDAKTTEVKKVETPAATQVISAAWWEDFKDKNLNSLVAQALEKNADVELAAARVAEARAVLAVNKSDRYPSVDVRGSASRTNLSEETALSTRDTTYNDFSLGALFSYELDLWGKISNANDSARARLLGTKYNQDAVRLAVAASTANLYFNIVSLNDQIRIAKATIKSRQDSYNIRKNLFDGGDIDELVLRQSESELASAKATLPVLEQRRTLQFNALNVLLGRSPQEIVNEKIPASFATKLPKHPALPKANADELVIRRPDIAAAEQELIASNADIGVARAAYLPSVSLSALLGVGADKIDNLFSGGTGLWNAGASIAGPVLNAGKTSGNVDRSLARRDQSEINYEQTVRIAYREVMDALVTNNKMDERYQAQTRQLDALRKSVELAKARYDAGYSSHIEVLDAERGLFDVELARVNTDLERLVAAINLYKALGGGGLQR